MTFCKTARAATEKQRSILLDAPLTRKPKSRIWAGTAGDHAHEAVQRVIDNSWLTLDIDRDPFGRTATITDEGLAALLAQ